MRASFGGYRTTMPAALILLAGLSSPAPVQVLLLSTGNSAEDSAIQSTL
jgi:hypothetical protein